jgi:hypothetical protein
VGEDGQAEALEHAARRRLAALLGPAAVAQTLEGPTAREPDGRSAPGVGGAREADAVTHARLLIERYGPTAAADMTTLCADMSGSGYRRSVSAKIKPRTAR